MTTRLLTASISTLAVSGFLLAPAVGENGTSVGEWQHYGGTWGSSKYSAADQLTRDNLDDLELAWRWNPKDVEEATGQSSRTFKVTPLMVDGMVYLSTGLNIVVALDPGTGERIWSYDPKAYDMPRGTHGGLSSRGIEYWTDGEDARIVIGTGGLQLIALNAKTGKPYPDFGDGGWTDLSKDLGRDFARSDYGLNSPVIICRDTIVVGSIVNDFGSRKRMPPGNVRGYDVRTGKMKWVFHTIPQAGETGVETWEDGAWEYTGNTNVWSMMTADEELGYVYLPIGTPTNDHYGGHRLGDNLFAESIVCLNAETGERVWHFQGVHHGIWDYDFPCAPNLIDIVVGGKPIKAVAQLSKQGFVYVLDRVTGEPVWPIKERSVPQSDVPGERAAATQPFPTKPPAFERQGITHEDLIDFTPELYSEALAIVENYVIGPLFTPPIVGGADGKLGMIQVPGMTGGANWPGGGIDPDTGFLYVQSVTRPNAMGLVKGDSSRSDLRYNRGRVRLQGPRGLPLVKPPYGRITAYDMNKGEIAWQIPHGEGPREKVNELIGDGTDVGPLGSSFSSGLAANGTLVTKTLLFVNQDEPPGESGGVTGIMRAYDKATGEVVWEKKLDTAPISPAMTYMHQGKQYIAFTVGGSGNELELHAYALRK